MADGCATQAPGHSGKTICRRAILAGMLAGSAACLVPRIARATAQDERPDRRFSIFYKGDRIGAHSTLHSVVDGRTRITTKIDLTVKALFFTLFAYRHRSEETWHNGRLAALSSETLEDGETVRVSGTATPQGFRVLSAAGPFIAAAGALTSNSLWNPAVLAQDTLIDAQHGGVIGLSVHKLPARRIVLPGRVAEAAGYRLITPYIAGNIWYDEAGRWVHGEFERDGAQILYRLEA